MSRWAWQHWVHSQHICQARESGLGSSSSSGPFAVGRLHVASTPAWLLSSPVPVTFVCGETCEASSCALPSTCSPFKSGQRSFKKTEEKKVESCSTEAMCSSSPKPAGKGETTAETQMTEKMSDLCPKRLAFLLVCFLPLDVVWLTFFLLLCVLVFRCWC